MRVSDSMFNELAATNLLQRRVDQLDAQRIAQTGIAVGKPSDDPVAAAGARATRSRERRAETVMKTSQEAIDRLQVVDGVLNDAGNLAARASELAIQGASDVLSASDRLTLAEEVTTLREQLLALANTEVEGERVFGGLAVDRAPFDPGGAFVGELTLRELEVGPGVRVVTQVSGAEAFGGAGGVNAFQTLDALDAALRADDGDAVSALLDDLTAVTEQIAHTRSAGGAAQQGLEQALAAAERTRDDAIRRRSALTEVDPVEAFTELVRAQNALSQALAIAQQLPPPSLLSQG